VGRGFVSVPRAPKFTLDGAGLLSSRNYHEGKYALPPTVKAFLKFGRAALATSNEYMKFLREVLDDFVKPIIQQWPKVQVFICGHSLGGFMAQAAALHLIDSSNANVFVTTTSAPGASSVYKSLGQRMFGSPALKPFPAAPQNIVNLVNYYDWIPRLGRQPGITCISTAKLQVKPNVWAKEACAKTSVLQFTGTSDAFGKCFAGPHNQFHPGNPNSDGTYSNVKCCAANARNCGIYVPIEIQFDPFFDDDDVYGDFAKPATVPTAPKLASKNDAPPTKANSGKSMGGKSKSGKTAMDGGDSEDSEDSSSEDNSSEGASGDGSEDSVGGDAEDDTMEGSIDSSFKGKDEGSSSNESEDQ